MLGNHILTVRAALMDHVDAMTGQLVMDIVMADMLIDRMEELAAMARQLEAQPVPPAARLGGTLPEGVTDLASARRRRKLMPVSGGDAA